MRYLGALDPQGLSSQLPELDPTQRAQAVALVAPSLTANQAETLADVADATPFGTSRKHKTYAIGAAVGVLVGVLVGKYVL